MYKYLKKSLFSLMILVIPYMNLPSKAMDEYDGSSTQSHVGMKKKFDDPLDVATRATSSQSINLDESPTSLVATVLSPFKYGFQVAGAVIEFAIEKPVITAAFCLMSLTSVAMAIATEYQCACLCTDPNKNIVSLGLMSSPGECQATCGRARMNIYSCAQVK
ncbi:MAG: hypothetical protein H0X26_07185 [Alphaproteobacteria bacterium]|nr:hypothetical protein [Alphaproteobacteria bacterium]